MKCIMKYVSSYCERDWPHFFKQFILISESTYVKSADVCFEMNSCVLIQLLKVSS